MVTPDPATLFAGRRYVSLESYDADGRPRRTPLDSVLRGCVLYARTDVRTWKVKRIRGNPHVRVALCDRAGIVRGDWFEGEATVLEGEEREATEAVFDAEYGRMGNLFIASMARLKGHRLTAVISIRLASHDSGG